MADDASGPSQAPSGMLRNSFQARACENCRLRKIRCDKSIPCSSCKTLGIECYAAARQTERRPRVVVSNQYERQIELIQERLYSIEKSLSRLSTNCASTPASSDSRDSATRTELQYESTAGPSFVPSSLFDQQTAETNEEAGSAIVGAIGAGSNSEVSQALSSLKAVMQPPTTSWAVEGYLMNSPQGNASVPQDMESLPTNFVAALIRRLKTTKSVLMVSLCWDDVPFVENVCQRVFFPTSPAPPGNLTVMHGMMYFLIREYAGVKDTEFSNFPDYDRYAEMCERNFCRGLETYETLTIPTLENCLALFLGASRAQEVSKLHLGWDFVTAGAKLCRMLGYHRESIIRSDPALLKTKKYAFWSLYMMDKNMSLNLGFPSNFQDYDIDTKPFDLSDDPKQRPWDLLATIMLRFSKVQGEVFDKLYSVAGSKASREERASVIDTLTRKLDQLRNDYLGVDGSDAYFSNDFSDFVEANEFITFSSLTTLYRADSLSSGASENRTKCYKYGRLSLEVHLKCFAALKEGDYISRNEYVNWVLLYASFTPFLVVFNHAISTSNVEDLVLLADTVRSLEMVKDVSRGAQRVHDVCRAFLRVAESFINAQQNALNTAEQPVASAAHQSAPQESSSAGLQQQQQLQQIPDFSWPNTFTTQGDHDLDMFLNDWLSTSKPVGDLLNLEMTEWS